jgi:hypothetical protein
MKIRYISWRKGRPRFNPGMSLRAMGYRGKDLRHPGGRWYSTDECTLFSAGFAAEITGKRGEARAAGRTFVKPGPRPTNHRGFVYFLRQRDRIKIGFSRNPLKRITSLKTGLSLGIETFAVVPGTEREERHALAELARFRQEG